MATVTKATERPWETLSPDEKLELRLQAWLKASEVKFASAQAEAAYRERVTNMIDAMTLRKTPARVPVLPTLGGFCAAYCGYTQYDLMHDVDKGIEVAQRCTLEFQTDGKIAAGVSPANVYERLDYKMYRWPGHGLPADADGIQFHEGEYMKEDEYDALIRDPSDYWLRTYLPRIMGALDPFKTLNPLVHIIEIVSVAGNVSRFGTPEVQAALKKIVQAGEDAQRWQQKTGAASRKLTEMGFPDTAGGSSRAPFDAIGDVLRGTRGIISDIYRRPDKLTEAMERFVPIMVSMGLAGARMGGPPIVGLPLHKGADGFMSGEHFKTFYWPTLRKVCQTLINEGLIVRLFAEGGYNTRLESVRDLPRGRVIWHFDYTDMARAKEVLGGIACLMGNVPVALIHAGTSEQTTDYCRRLIDTAGKGGGFILATGAGVGAGGKAENVRAMIRCSKEYGVYS